MKYSALFEAEEIFYLPIEQKKRIYRYGFGCEIYSQQKIYLPEREIYIWCPQMVRHIKQKEKMKSRNYYLVELNPVITWKEQYMRKRYYKYDLVE